MRTICSQPHCGSRVLKGMVATAVLLGACAGTSASSPAVCTKGAAPAVAENRNAVQVAVSCMDDIVIAAGASIEIHPELTNVGSVDVDLEMGPSRFTTEIRDGSGSVVGRSAVRAVGRSWGAIPPGGSMTVDAVVTASLGEIDRGADGSVVGLSDVPTRAGEYELWLVVFERAAYGVSGPLARVIVTH